MQLKNSRFNIKIPFQDKYIIYNTLHSSIVVLSAKDFHRLEKNEYEYIDPQTLTALKKNGIIIEDSFDELLLFKVLYNIHKCQCHDLEFVIVPTFNCNLICTYCYEGLDKKKDTMNNETVEKVIKFIQKEISKKNPKKVAIRFYGGEPLLCKEIIIKICERLEKLLLNTGVSLDNISIISNGTLITESFVKKMKKYPLTIAVTLNGPKEIHNENRKYVTGEGTYEDIIKNLKILKKYNIKTYLCINVDSKAYPKIERLLIDLLKENLKFPLNFSPVVQVQKACNYPHPAPLEVLLRLWDMALEKGFEIAVGRDLPQRFFYCKPLTLSSYAIGPRGEVFACLSLCEDYWKLGEIDEDGNLNKVNYVLFSKWFGRDPLSMEDCVNCKILPICCGGCPAFFNIPPIPDDWHIKPVCFLNINYVIGRVKLYLKQNFPTQFKDLSIASSST